MQKDVIYIDVEDDITAIIGKVKLANNPIIALVPPKRIGAIQSAVNLKLVQRAAQQSDKRLVIISNNAALMALAGSAGIPVAKNLQSKPELAEISALDVDEGEDVIDGSSEQPTTQSVGESSQTASAIEAEKSNTATDSGAKSASAVTAGLGASAVAMKNKVKIPNFDSFRKKLFFGIAGLVALVGFLVWALVFAPQAQVIITARTTDAALNSSVMLGDTLQTNLSAGTIKSEIKTSKKDISIPFTATGKKDVGEKATGSVRIKTDAATILVSGLTVPAGTELQSAGGSTYTTTQPAIFAKGDASGLNGVVVGVLATASGASYNGATGAASTSASGVTSVAFVSSTAGGTDKTITVVQQSDVDAVSGEILKSGEADAARADLKKQLGDGYIVFDSTFVSKTDAVKPAPAVDAEATDGKATLSGQVTFSIVAVAKDQAKHYLDDYFKQQIDGKPDQKIYSNGLKTVSFTNIATRDDKYSANISTNGKIGPKIDEDKLRAYVKGKSFDDIKTYIESIDGVDNADVKFSPFWVSKAPNNTKKITIEFKVNGV